MNIDEVKRTIQGGNQVAKSGRATLEQLDSEVAATEAYARITIHDSQDQDAQAGLEILTGFHRETELTVRRVDAAVDHANAYLGTIG